VWERERERREKVKQNKKKQNNNGLAWSFVAMPISTKP